MSETTVQPLSSVAQRIVNAVASGEAVTRVDLAKCLGLAPSTISVRVQNLLDSGVFSESGEADSRGGRRATILSVRQRQGHLLVAELGSFHVRVGLASLEGELGQTVEYPLEIDRHPDVVFDELLDRFREFQDDCGVVTELSGVCVGIPGPVEMATGRVRYPSRMPGWNQYLVSQRLDSLGCPVVVENDANLMALGEHSAHAGLSTSIAVKAGTGIGSGLIVDGHIFRGATGAAGDLSHARLPDGESVPCACGNTGCLETTASGGALVRQLREMGHDVSRTSEVITMARNGDADATRLVRRSGRSLGAMLCPIVGFVNPQAVFLGGQLSSLDIFVAAVRGQLYDGCHPLATSDLIIGQTRLGENAPLVGAAHLLSRRVAAIG